jgi:general secretion pathway protein I
MRRVLRARRRGGFTLLEVMISLAILGGALVVLLRLSTSDIRASHRAKLLTIATGLARAKMLDLEEELLRNGFQDTEQEVDGDFSEEGQPRFTFSAVIEKVELPDAAELAEGMEGDKPSGSTPPPSPLDEQNQDSLLGLSGGSMAGALGAGMVQLYFPLIRPVLENAIRKVTLEVHWGVGRERESLKVIAFFTDTKAIEQAAQAARAMSGGGGAGGAGGGGAGGAAGGGTGRGGITPPPGEPK